MTNFRSLFLIFERFVGWPSKMTAPESYSSGKSEEPKKKKKKYRGRRTSDFFLIAKNVTIPPINTIEREGV